jgi:hypothetical protein
VAADFSKVRFNPYLNHAGVELQQGRVLLDADANELVAVFDRRLRALAGDVLGRATVGANTPEAFKLSVVAGSLAIGRGRLYVDGLLAENHGSGSPGFDPLMAGPTGSTATLLRNQPWLKDAPVPAGGRHLVYLDVWTREVTHLEQPDLVEAAIGVDSTSRLQTVWQVRVLPDVAPAGVDCSTPDALVPGWPAVIAPSGGRLTTGTFDAAPADDPCELPPEGGYRGLENQLYRVEIHDPGQPGAGATFKWSRENASVGSRVSRVLSPTRVEVQSLGRDDVLRFSTGDWVEFIDDVRELSGRAGELRRVTVDDDARTLAFTGTLGDLLPPDPDDLAELAARNLRVRRWDQKGRVLRVTTGGGGSGTAPAFDLDGPSSTGAIPVPATGTLLLENGITVSFEGSGGAGLRTGDHWVFAARTLDASLERLDAAPPRGIHHHRARLGFWDIGAGTVSDCRHPWPPQGGDDCACTLCVTPESHASGRLTLQGAVDRIRETGGTICLQPGSYALTEPVRIDGAKSLRIEGKGPATLIGSSVTAFIVQRSLSVAITDLAILCTAKAAPAILARTVAGLALQRLGVLMAGDGATAVALGGAVAGASLRDNLFIAANGVAAARGGRVTAQPAPASIAGSAAGAAAANATNAANADGDFLFTASARIEDNIFWCGQRGIDFTGVVGHLYATRIAGNDFIGCRGGGIDLAGFCMPGASMQVQGNTLAVSGPGIRCGVDGAWISDNKLHAQDQGRNPPVGAGISLVTGLDPNGSDQCQVLANQVSGFPDAGLVIEAPVKSLIVKLNIIEDCGNGILMTDDASAATASIENNHLHDLGLRQANNPRARSVIGIGVLRAESCNVVGNTLRRIGLSPVERTAQVAGIIGAGVAAARVHGNDLQGIGPAGDFRGTVGGILWRGPYDELDLSHNQVRRDEDPVAAPGASAWIGIEVAQAGTEQPVLRAIDYTAMRVDAARTVVIQGNRATLVTSRAPARGQAGNESGSSLGLKGNVVVARGLGRAVAARAGADLMFCDNRCELNGTRVDGAVALAAGTVIASANRVTGGERSMLIAASPKQMTVLGNITSNGIAVPGGALDPQWAALNVTA